jgi:MFS family permease
MNSGKPRKSRKTTELADHHHRDLTKRSLGRDPGRAFAGRRTAPYIQAMSVTLRQVAEEAGVSPGTASRALRGHPQVAPDCTARVRAAAARLGYAPLRDRSGRARPQPLEGKRIAIAMLGIDRTLASLPVVAEAIHGAEEALAEAGAHPILVNMADPAEPPRSLRRVKFDGMLAKAALQGRIMEALGPRLRATLGHTPLVWLLVGSFVGAYLVGWLGRRASYLAISLGATAATLGMFNLTAPLEPWFRQIVCLQGFVSTLFFGWLAVYLPAIFPLEVRAAGSGLAYNFGRFVTAAGVLAAGGLFAALGGDYVRIGTVTSLVYALGAVAIWFVEPAPRPSSGGSGR